jgi:dolichol-phosphate mannosyltransferase
MTEDGFGSLFVSEAESLGKPLLSVVVPAYREEEYIEQTLRGIKRVSDDSNISAEIIVVVDVVPGDKTVDYVHKVSEGNPELRVHERLGKRGVGDAVRTGIGMARGEVLVVAMGDQSEDPNEIVRLAKSCLDYDIVFTNRFRHGRPRGYPFVKYVANRACNYAVKWLAGIPYSDTTNAFKAYKLETLKQVQLASDGFEIFLEIPLKIMQCDGIRSREIEASHAVRKKKAPKLSVTKDGYRYLRVLLTSRRDHPK